jgi:hypothetical protein
VNCQICDRREAMWYAAALEEMSCLHIPERSQVALCFPITVCMCLACRDRIKRIEVRRDRAGKPEELVVTYRMIL